jgi:hypothetical protein
MGSGATDDEEETCSCDGCPCVNGRTREAMAMVEGSCGKLVLLGKASTSRLLAALLAT